MFTPSWESNSIERLRRTRPEFLPSRLAAIDIGTNSIRLVVAQVDRDGTYRILDEEREVARLGEGLDHSGSLSEQAMERALQALAKMKAIADGFQVRQLRAIATSAVREADNGEQFRVDALRRFGITIDVISPDDEARFAFQSAVRHFKLEGTLTAVVDIGGGSAEIVLAAETMIERVFSLPLGAVRLTERFSLADVIDAKKMKRLNKGIDRVLKQQIGKPPFDPETMIGSGGTFTTLAEIIRSRREGKSDCPHGYLMTVAEVEELCDELGKMNFETRKRVQGLSPSRADIIVAGAAVIVRLAKRLGTQQILVNDKGIRDGLLLSMIGQQYERIDQTPQVPRDRMEWARRFSRKCRSDEQHCDQVGKLALELFDQLRESSSLTAECRDILQAAALLHDVGYLINHERHHKHAYHLIMNGELPSFSAREIELIANVARYHRRAMPKKSHANFANLSSDDRTIVRRLAGILRVADGLDRTHTARVKHVICERTEDTVRFVIEADSDPHVEIWYADGKSDLFAEAFNIAVEFMWAKPGSVRDNSNVRPAPACAEQVLGV